MGKKERKHTKHQLFVNYGDEAKKQRLLADQVIQKVDDFHTQEGDTHEYHHLKQLAKLETERIVYEEHQIATRSTSMGVSASVDNININNHQQRKNRIASQPVVGNNNGVGGGGSHDDFEINTRQQAASMTQMTQQGVKPTFAEKAIDGTIGRLSRQHSLNPVNGMIGNDGSSIHGPNPSISGNGGAGSGAEDDFHHSMVNDINALGVRNVHIL